MTNKESETARNKRELKELEVECEVLDGFLEGKKRKCQILKEKIQEKENVKLKKYFLEILELYGDFEKDFNMRSVKEKHQSRPKLNKKEINQINKIGELVEKYFPEFFAEKVCRKKVINNINPSSYRGKGFIFINEFSNGFSSCPFGTCLGEIMKFYHLKF